MPPWGKSDIDHFDSPSHRIWKVGSLSRRTRTTPRTPRATNEEHCLDQLPPDIARQLHPDRRKNEEAYWAVRDQFLEHVGHAKHEYNRLYAHPFEWTWTNQRMRQWFARHVSPTSP